MAPQRRTAPASREVVTPPAVASADGDASSEVPFYTELPPAPAVPAQVIKKGVSFSLKTD
jgi:hypothetical protein